MDIPHVQKPEFVHDTCHDQNHFITVLLDGRCPTCHGKGYFSIK